MKRLLDQMLRKYDENDHELLLKAKFLILTTMVTIIALAIAFVYTCYTFGIDSLTVMIISLGLAVTLAALILLIKGFYWPAVHAILTTGFSVAWILMFSEPVSSVIIKMDTIVYIIGFMSVMPLMFFKTRRPMVLYFILNASLFTGFAYHIHLAEVLSPREQVDYIMDNAIAMIFVFLVSFSLVTIHRKVLDTLKEYRAFLGDMINAMPSVIIGIDRDDRIIMWNREARRIFKLGREAVRGRNLYHRLPWFESMASHIRDAMDSGSVFRAHKKTMPAADKVYTVDMMIYPLPKAEGGVVIRVDDISERLKLDELIVQSEKMRSIGGLAAGMAHELNNPLAGMIQNAQLVEKRLTGSLPANETAAREMGLSMDRIQAFMEKRGVLQQLSHIKTAGKRASEIVANMLGFARNSGITRETCTLAELIEDTLILAQNDPSLKGIKIVNHAGPEDGQGLWVEKSKLQQAIFNILKNASEALEEVASPDHSPCITLSLSQDPDFVNLTIADNGPGMDEETRKQVFDPFFTTKPVDKGTGLGLYVAYFIVVENHGGKMAVASSPGKGAAFTMGLPKTSV